MAIASRTMQAFKKTGLLLERFCPLTLVEIRTASHLSGDSSRSFKFADIRVQLEDKLQQKPDISTLKFGNHFSDHMFEVAWSEAKGWGTPRIVPFHNFQLHPAAKVLHYASELFEGMKAYTGVDHKIRLFRPDLNMARMLNTSKRLALPEFDGKELTRCIAKLIDVDREWVPQNTNSSLYIRPTLIGTEPTLGVAKSSEALLYVIVGPVGPYFPSGFKPISLLADPKFVRSWPGGAGAYKMGSNYAPTIHVAKEAAKQGCQQVLWLFGDKHYLTEVGTMNIFVYWINEKGEKELLTPPLDGLILPGVTRQSILDLTQTWSDLKAVERSISMKDILKAKHENRLLEIFGAGTACVVCPVSRILYEGKNVDLPQPGSRNSVTQRIHDELLDIQYGRTKNHPWAVEIDAILGKTPEHHHNLHDEAVPMKKRAMKQ
ncbi:branched-chain-amino-acid aminotransferase, cytosolic-like [Paramacrobiotus metropolitanus]|uniref:branched-chain-amino-acid aminotransferase, cytosolic-like n=1 Tax=Paramacrobiotus metropolitanus TaxID=2943436 RepID=UPI002445C01F|nr:branched-chain-amino-acid aminotransferase, cytosolic-like [Paramacrobiotus metropolitanus]